MKTTNNKCGAGAWWLVVSPQYQKGFMFSPCMHGFATTQSDIAGEMETHKLPVGVNVFVCHCVLTL